MRATVYTTVYWKTKKQTILKANCVIVFNIEDVILERENCKGIRKWFSNYPSLKLLLCTWKIHWPITYNLSRNYIIIFFFVCTQNQLTCLNTFAIRSLQKQEFQTFYASSKQRVVWVNSLFNSTFFYLYCWWNLVR